MTNVIKIKKKPVVVEAMQYTGGNYHALREWGAPVQLSYEMVYDEEVTNLIVYVDPEGDFINVPVGHFVIKGVRGEYYPIADDILEETYDIVGEIKCKEW